MPEISARDLRRLETLEGRLTKARDERTALAADRRKLREAAGASARLAREAEQRAAAAGDQLEALLAENRRLATGLEEQAADLERLRAAGAELRTQADSAQEELAKARAKLAEIGAQLGDVKGERDQLAERVKIADDQLAGKKMTPVLPAKDVATIVGRFVTDLSSGLPGVVLRDGEVRLQVAFGKVGTAAGFVVPSAESPEDVRKNLHEVSIRFDRSIDVPPGPSRA